MLRAAMAHTVHYERRRPEETILHRLVREHLETFLAQVEAAGTGLPKFVKDEFDAFLECDILAHGFLRLRCAGCGHEKLVAFSCKRRGICPSCGARRMAQSLVPRPRLHLIRFHGVLAPHARLRAAVVPELVEKGGPRPGALPLSPAGSCATPRGKNAGCPGPR